MNYKFLDILLLPRTIYQKITDKKATLYAGILFVGVVDIVFPLIIRQLSVFKGKPQTVLNYNIGLVLLFSLLLGFLDVIFFTLPLFDFFKFMKKGTINSLNATLTKFAKVYIIAHLLVLPFNILFVMLLYNPTGAIVPESMQILAVIYSFFFMPAWFAGIIARGANVLFNTDYRLKPLVFAAIFTWNYLLGEYALPYIIENWVMYFFK